MDLLVRESYAGKIAILLVTMERKVFSKLTESCRDRILEISVDEVLKDESTAKLSMRLVRNSQGLQLVLKKFDEWYPCQEEGNRYDYCIMQDMFRKKYGDRDNRNEDLSFAYFLSIK